MNGIIIINKPTSYTSRDIINILNKKFNTKKIGHTGTLDPLATGVLVICIGKYTKLVEKITAYQKEYIATIKLGIKTDTLDTTGKILEKDDNINVDNQVLINTLNSFLGESMQEVPIYSAVKINGKKLYEYARNKKNIKLPKRKIKIKEIELISNINGEITFRTLVSKGTYIRSLIRDICNSLNVLGSMSSLIRTKQGSFDINNSYSLEDINNNNYELLTVKQIFNYPIHNLNEYEYQKVKNGNPLALNFQNEYLILDYQEKTIAIYHLENNIYKSYFML